MGNKSKNDEDRDAWRIWNLKLDIRLIGHSYKTSLELSLSTIITLSGERLSGVSGFMLQMQQILPNMDVILI